MLKIDNNRRADMSYVESCLNDSIGLSAYSSLHLQKNLNIAEKRINSLSKILEDEYASKLQIIENMKPSEEELEQFKERNKKLIELKHKIKDDRLSDELKEKLINEFLSMTVQEDNLRQIVV